MRFFLDIFNINTYNTFSNVQVASKVNTTRRISTDVKHVFQTHPHQKLHKIQQRDLVHLIPLEKLVLASSQTEFNN